MLNLKNTHAGEAALEGLGIDMNAIGDEEPEPGLGNGGWGHLAAMLHGLHDHVGRTCHRLRFALRVRNLPAGDQGRLAGRKSDKWLEYGNPWVIPASDASQRVMFGGHTEAEPGEIAR